MNNVIDFSTARDIRNRINLVHLDHEVCASVAGTISTKQSATETPAQHVARIVRAYLEGVR